MGRPSLAVALLAALTSSCRDDIEFRPRQAPNDALPVEAMPPTTPPQVASGPDSGPAAPPDHADASTKVDGCSGQSATIAELSSGLVPTHTALLLDGVVATSQKFLVSDGGEKCWYGAFVADRGRSGAGSGLLLLAAAPHAAGAEPCPPGRDAFPDDLAPGDVVDAFGTLTEFAPAACSDRVPQVELIVHDGCPLSRRERGVTQPVTTLDPVTADRVAQGLDPALLSDWGGMLVRLENVNALPAADGFGAVGPYGVIRLSETALEVHTKIFFNDLSGAGPGSSTKSPRFAYPTAFRAITGLIYLDYCSWSLAPRDKCVDFDPPSVDCP